MIRERRKVLFLVPAFAGGVGGAERIVTTVLRRVDHSRFECHYALVLEGGAFEEDLPPNVAVHRLHASRMRHALPGIIRLVWDLAPQTIVATVSYLNMTLVLARPFLPRGVRLLLCEATTPSVWLSQDTRHPRLWTWLYRHLYPRAEKIVCFSDASVEDMVAHYAIPREKVVRIYTPVDVAMVRQAAAAQPNPYTRPGPHVVVAARLQREKGIDLVLDALPAVVRRFPDVRLVVLGEGSLDAELKEQAARLGVASNVDFLGFQRHPWPYLGHADVFVLPSRVEGMPNALLEALALGTPAVATDCVGGIREVRASNEQVVLVPPEDPNALAEGILSILSRPVAARATVEQSAQRLQRFDPHDVAEQYSRLF